jgi:PAS domain S-box-containing protein
MTRNPTYKELGRGIKIVEELKEQSTKDKRMEKSLRESEERFRTIFEQAAVGVAQVESLTGRFVRINQKYCDIIGYSREEMLDKCFQDITYQDDLSSNVSDVARLMAEEVRTFSTDKRYLHKNGSVVWVNLSVSPMWTEGQQPVFHIAIVQDITDHKRAEENARRLAQENATMAEIGRIISSTLNVDEVYEVFATQVKKVLPFDRIVISIICPDKNTIRNVYIAGDGIVDRNTENIYSLEGSGHAEMLRLKSTLLIQTEDFSEYEDRFPALWSTFQAGFRSIMNVPLFSKGEIIGALLLRSRRHPAYSEGDVRLAERISAQIAGAIANVLLFNDLRKTEKTLQESEENFRTFFSSVDDMIIVGSPDGKIFYTNPAMTQKLGYSPDEFKNMHVLDVHPAEKRQEAETIFTAMFRGELDFCPLPLESKTGVLVPVETRAWFGKWSGTECIFGICKDLTREQEALQKFNRFFNSNPAPMAVSSLPERRFTDVNDAFLNVLGYSRLEVIGKTSAELGLFAQPEKHQEIGDQLQEEGRIADRELKIKCKDGTMLTGLFSGEIIESQGEKYFLTVMIDQTERKRAEEELKRHQKHLEEMVKERTMDLEIKSTTLQELNTTLKVLLKQREDDKKDMEKRFVMNVQNLVLPYIAQVKKGRLDVGQRSYLDIIETHLNEITTPLLKNIRQFNLTPTEIKVATLVKQGISTKKAAEILNIARGSIDVHRKKIRSKLGLSNRRVNLQSYLENLD